MNPAFRFASIALLVICDRVVNGHTLYKCPASSPDCTTDGSSDIITGVTLCERASAGQPFSNGRFSAETQTSYIQINSGATFDSAISSDSPFSEICPPQQTISGATYESDEMMLCGFQASRGSTTGNQFDGFKAIFCHKYSWSTQQTKTLFNAKGGNVAGITQANWSFGSGGAPTLYLGQGDSDSGQCFTGLQHCERNPGDSCLGISLAGLPSEASGWDFCICPNWPICPYGFADGVSVPSYSDPAVMCDNGQFIDSVQFDTESHTSIKFRCSDVTGIASVQASSRSSFKTVGVDSGNNADVYTAEGSHFCGVQAKFGATINNTISYQGLLSLNLMLCKSYNCRDSLYLTSNTLEDRTYKVVPGNSDFEKPAIYSISQQTVSYGQTQDQSDDTLHKISHYLTNSDNHNCPINTCELMENCNSSPSKKNTDASLIWQPTSAEIISLASQSTADWASHASGIHIYHVNTDPTSLFKFTNLCIQCKNIDRYGKRDKTITSRTFSIEIQCRGGINIEMAGNTTGSSSENSLINSLVQTQHVSHDLSLRPKFNFTSFYTTTKACPVDFYQISQNFYSAAAGSVNVATDYYSYPAGIVPKSFTDSDESTYTNQDGPIDIDEVPSPTVSGTVSSSSFNIEVFDGEMPFVYEFRIKAWALGGLFTTSPLLRQPNEGLSSFVSQPLTLRTICPTFTGNTDELQPDPQPSSGTNPLFNHLTWIGAPASQSIYSLNQPFSTKLPKCLRVTGYQLVDESIAGVLTPSSSCSTIPCESWDISTSVAQVVTFKVRISTDLGYTYDSLQVQVTISSSSSSQPDIQPSDVSTVNGNFQVGDTRLLEIDQFTETRYGLQTSNYILMAESPGCGSFMASNVAGSMQSNGKIGFVVDTSSIQSSCTVKVYAEVQIIPQISCFSSLFTISVSCGSENISIHSSVPLPEEELFFALSQSVSQSPYSLTNFNGTGQPIFVSSSPTNCPITSTFTRDSVTAGCSPSAGSKITLSGTQLIFDASASFQETICVKAQTSAVTNSPTLFKLQITVCGQETLIPSVNGLSSKIIVTSSGSPISFDIPESLFVQNYAAQSAGSKDWCLRAMTYEIKSGDNCLGTVNPLAFSIDSSVQPKRVTVHAVAPSSLQTFCIKATSQGQVSAVQKFQVQVCGDETLSFEKSPNKPSVFTFDRTEADQEELLQLSDLGFSFTTSRPSCQMNYKLIEIKNGLEQDITGINEIQIDQQTGSLRVKTKNPYEFEGVIRAYSLNEFKTQDSSRFNLTVCGYEYINTTDYLILETNYNQGWKHFRMKWELFTKFIDDRLNNTLCSVKSYQLQRENEGGVYEDITEDEAKDFSIEGLIFQMNTGFDIEQYGFEHSGYYEFVFYIKTITRGLKQFYTLLDIRVTDHELGMDQTVDNGFFLVFPLNSNDNCRGIKKVTEVTFLAKQTIDPDYIILLEEIIIPAIVTDQPNDQPVDDDTLVSFMTIIIYKDKLRENAFKYQLANPDSVIDSDNILIAMEEGLYFNLKADLRPGEDGKPKKCDRDLGPFSDWVANELNEDKEEDVARFKSRLKTIQDKLSLTNTSLGTDGGNSIQLGQNKAFSINFEGFDGDENEIVSKLKLTGVQVVSYDANLDILMRIQFNRLIEQIDDQLIDELSEIFTLHMKSAVDQSRVKGIYIPKFLEECKNTKNLTCNHQDFQFKSHKNFIDWASEHLQLKWKYHNMTGQEIFLNLEFQFPFNISSNNFGQDQIILTIHENYLIADKENGLPLQEKYLEYQVSKSLQQIATEPELEEQIKANVEQMATAVKILQASGMFLRILLAKSLQDIWAALNTQIITAHMMLFTCQTTMPGNAYIFNSIFSQFAQMDMYPTDQIYGALFNFTSKQYPIEQFEWLGYDEANFVVVTGSVLINILLPLVVFMIQLIALNVTYCCKDSKSARKFGSKITQINIKNAIGPLYIVGYLELMFCAIISIQNLTMHDFRSGSWSDFFSAIFLLISMFVLVYIPLKLIYVAKKYEGSLDDPEILSCYGYLYQDISTETFWTSSFNFIFMVRRTLFVLIIIEFYGHRGIQLILNLFLTIGYMIYLGHVRPYKDKNHNNWQIFNELCVLVVTYFLMWYSIFPGYDIADGPIGFLIGKFYMIAASLNIVCNLLKMGYSLVVSIPHTYRSLKYRFKENQYQQRKKQYHKLKLEKFKKYPQSEAKRLFLDESNKIMAKDLYLQQIAHLEIQHQQERKWAQGGKFTGQQYQDFLESEFQKEKDELELKYMGQIKRENEELGIMDVKLQISNMINGKFIHNDVDFLIGQPPYEERKYLKIQDSFINVPMKIPENVKKMNDKLIKAQKKSLLQFLERQQYLCLHVAQDGNSAAKSISLRKFGNTSSYKLIRKDLCDFMRNSLEKRLVNDKPTDDYWKKSDFINNLERSAIEINDLQLKVCSNQQNFPIVIFSIENKMMFFDSLVTPLKKTQIQECPLFLLKQDGHYTPLIHRAQRRLIKFLSDNGTKLSKFKANDFSKPNIQSEIQTKEKVEKTQSKRKNDKEQARNHGQPTNRNNHMLIRDDPVDFDFDTNNSLPRAYGKKVNSNSVKQNKTSSKMTTLRSNL